MYTERQRDVSLMVATVESKSEHPLARAVGRHALSAIGLLELPSHVQISGFEGIAGLGVRATVEGSFPSLPGQQHSVSIGNATFLAHAHVRLPPALDAFRAKEERCGRTVVLAAVDGSLACVISISDKVKPEARQTIDALRWMGINVEVVTGDQLATALAIAAEVGIEGEHVHAGVSPNGKREIVERLRSQGHRVAMVSCPFILSL